MNKSIIGENAGILWRFLSTDAHKRWELTEVKKVLEWMIWNWPARSDGWHVKIKFSLNSSTQMGKIKRHTYILC